MTDKLLTIYYCTAIIFVLEFCGCTSTYCGGALSTVMVYVLYEAYKYNLILPWIQVVGWVRSQGGVLGPAYGL